MRFDQYRGATVVVTGHTGFKGAWLTAWLQQLGATVVGIALDPPSQPSHFVAANLARSMTDLRIDIRDGSALQRAVLAARPDFVFHLAAQSLVRNAYQDPIATWQTNVLGTLNVLETLRNISWPCYAVIITSDKCYENVEWVWGYRETDTLGGPDPYSASKGAAELAIRSHIKSYFPAATSQVRIASARAGNVIGGGDWAADRIVPDCVRAWASHSSVDLRNPHATRPWQHVLEPLSGYLALGLALRDQPETHGQPFNFGPPAKQNQTVLALVKSMSRYWDQVRWRDVSQESDGPYESGLLKLNCDKALHQLRWEAALSFDETVALTAEWYRAYYDGSSAIERTTREQIARYSERAVEREIAWAR